MYKLNVGVRIYKSITINSRKYIIGPNVNLSGSKLQTEEMCKKLQVIDTKMFLGKENKRMVLELQYYLD
jgi:hypothetical protein